MLNAMAAIQTASIMILVLFTVDRTIAFIGWQMARCLEQRVYFIVCFL